MRKKKLRPPKSTQPGAQQIKRVSASRPARKSAVATDESTLLDDRQLGQVVTHYGANLDVEDTSGQIHHCMTRSNLPELVCGDRVMWQAIDQHAGVIVSLVPRQSLLVRPNFRKHPKPVAANIDQMLVVVAPLPAIDEDLIDRYLVAAKLTEITPHLVVNKIDLLSPHEYHAQRERLSVYAHIGYSIIETSTRQQHGLEALLHCLEGKTSVLVGQSGVGKSSLILSLIPDADIRVREVSPVTGLGRHTTTVTILYHLQNGGNIIDSPGVREFGLDHASQRQIAQGFIEFSDYLGHCKFSDCKHVQEPDCAIKQAVATGDITQQRYTSYLRILQSMTT
jgi:ribosome biogenesis GTPase